MDDALSLEELCEEGLIAKHEKKTLLQKLQTRFVDMLHHSQQSKHRKGYQEIRIGSGVGTRASPEDSLGHLHREGSSDHLHSFPDQNRFNAGKKNARRIISDENRSEHRKNAQQSHPFFHLSHPRLRLHFHSACCLNLHHPLHLDFHKKSQKQKRAYQSELPKDIPKGFLAVYVGPEHQRFVIPVLHLNHPLFEELLKEMEEEFGFNQNGALLIPCEVADFELLRSRIGRENPCKTRSNFCRTNNQDQPGD